MLAICLPVCYGVPIPTTQASTLPPLSPAAHFLLLFLFQRLSKESDDSMAHDGAVTGGGFASRLAISFYARDMRASVGYSEQRNPSNSARNSILPHARNTGRGRFGRAAALQAGQGAESKEKGLSLLPPPSFICCWPLATLGHVVGGAFRVSRSGATERPDLGSRLEKFRRGQSGPVDNANQGGLPTISISLLAQLAQNSCILASAPVQTAPALLYTLQLGLRRPYLLP